MQRAASRSTIRLGSGVVWERLTTESIRNVDFLHVTYEVGGESSPADAFQRHTGQEWGYVLSGTLTVRIGFDEYVLQPGDAISFDSATPTGCSTPATSRRGRSGSSSAAGRSTSSSADRGAPDGRRRLRRGCNPA